MLWGSYMAVIVTELSAVGTPDPSGNSAPMVNAASIKEQQSLTIDGAASAAFGASTTYVEIDSDTACRLEFGADPDGGGDTLYLPASTPRQFGVTPGHKVIAVGV